MTKKLLDARLASSKSDRKKRQKGPEIADTAATERALATIRKTFATQATKASNIDRLRTKAINDTMGDFIAAMDEETLQAFFFSLERLATSANRKRIATHPLRSDIVDEMHEEADAEEEALRAEAEDAELAAEEARQATTPTSHAGALKAMQQTAAQDETGLS